MDTITLKGSPILGPREPWDRVTLDWSSDAEFLALVDGHVTHGTSESGGGSLHALLGSRLDCHGGIGSAIGSKVRFQQSQNSSRLVNLFVLNLINILPSVLYDAKCNSNFSLPASNFFGRRKLAEKLFLQPWWNWPQDTFGWFVQFLCKRRL